MVSMDVPDLMAAYATRVRLIPDFAGVSYPIRDTVPASPWAMIKQSDQQATIYEKQAGRQVVMPFIDIVILVKSQEETPREQTKIDTLVTPVLDLFDANTVGGNINAAFPDLPGPIDRVWLNATVQRFAVNWGSSGFCYAARITLDSQFRRQAVPLGGAS
jgi:hypothetical protein